MVKYSIILPIYKVENYLEECVNSVLTQKIIDYELILVDDGSPDNCPKMCDEFAKKDSRIKVVHKKNGGLSDARNAGIKVAKGKYILFIDPDDYVEKDYLEVIDKNVGDSDLLVFCYYSLWRNKKKKEFGENRILNKDEALSYLMADDKFCGYAWNKVFKKDIIDKNNLSFDSGVIMCEDVLFSYEYINRIDRVKIISDALINYRQRKSSIVSSRVRNINTRPMFVTYKYIMNDSDNKQVQKRSKYLYLKAFYKYKRNGNEDYIDKELVRNIIKNDFKTFTDGEKKMIRIFKYAPHTRTVLYGIRDILFKKYD